MSVQNISCSELRDKLDNNIPITILDVRQKWETDICSFPQFMHVPLDNLPNSLDKIEDEVRKGKLLVVVCHHGVRSYHACRWLLSNNVEGVVNLQGGIDKWADDCEPQMAKY